MTRTIGRIVAALALGAVVWLGFGGAPAGAVPGQVMVEYGGTLEAGRPDRDSPAPVTSESGWDADDVRQWVTDNAPFLVVGVGALLVVGTWKFITR